MLDSVTKKRIDDLRNILVGKIPSPQSQVEQITTGLIYKFMYDMDNEAIEMGGVPSFFIDDYEKYSWKHLFNTKLGGVEKIKLYSDAIENLYNNPNAPSIFREIFKNSFLPFKDPSTLNMFLKEINEFHYSNSEQLGDAYEYLLSFMGSQGDAGQFRTPRHIIDFIIQIVNPNKHETILDPACGTSGFLISSYKHILNQNTQSRIGDKLNASERKQIGDNLVGYDIDPAMSRISLVNMYLHNFASPNISEYDTLSSEDKWNEYFDIILANPPFFSPTGGIKPHSRFGVKSNRAEVLFVDYIIEHLKPNGRAGIIVPEGIIFQTGTAYKTLRKKLVEDCLVGIISLPAGVFQPYSGVKTSILILDKELNQKSDIIYIAKVENDGFSLGAQRSPISKNDLLEILSSIKKQKFNNDFLSLIHKTDILNEPTINLSSAKYLQNAILESDFNFVTLGEVTNFINGFAFKSSDMFKEETSNSIRVLKIGNITPFGGIDTSKSEFHKWREKFKNVLVGKGDFVVAMTGATVGKVARIIDGKFLLNQRVGCLRANEQILPNYLKSILLEERFYNYCQSGADGGAQGNISPTGIKEYKFPLPPIKVQQQIVDELEGFQKIINGCRQVVEHYKPTIDINPSWEKVKLSTLGETKSGGTPKRTETEYWNGEISWYSSGELNNLFTVEPLEKITQSGLDNSNCKVFPKGSLLIGMYDTAAFKMSILSEDAAFNQAIFAIKTNEKVNVKFLYLYLAVNRENYLFDRVGVRQRNLSKGYIDEIVVSLPNIDIQDSIVQHFDIEFEKIQSVRELIDIYTQKIQDRISKVWCR